VAVCVPDMFCYSYFAKKILKNVDNSKPTEGREKLSFDLESLESYIGARLNKKIT
jgi:hypothetical protein